MKKRTYGKLIWHRQNCHLIWTGIGNQSPRMCVAFLPPSVGVIKSKGLNKLNKNPFAFSKHKNPRRKGLDCKLCAFPTLFPPCSHLVPTLIKIFENDNPSCVLSHLRSQYESRSQYYHAVSTITQSVLSRSQYYHAVSTITQSVLPHTQPVLQRCSACAVHDRSFPRVQG